MTQDLRILPATALPVQKLLQLGQGIDPCHRIGLLRTDKTDAITEDAQLHRKTNVIQRFALRGRTQTVGHKQVGVLLSLHNLSHPDTVHRWRGSQLVVTEAIAGLLQRQLQQIAKIEGTQVPIALGADMSDDVARPQGAARRERLHSSKQEAR